MFASHIQHCPTLRTDYRNNLTSEFKFFLSFVCQNSGLDTNRSTRHHGLVDRVYRDRNRITSPHQKPLSIDKHGRQISFKTSVCYAAHVDTEVRYSILGDLVLFHLSCVAIFHRRSDSHIKTFHMALLKVCLIYTHTIWVYIMVILS